jgi:hypothetical protein
MRRGGAFTLLAVVGLGLVGLLVTAAHDESDLAFTLGVVPTIPAAKLRPGAQVCQGNVTVPAAFTRVRVKAGSPGGPGQPLALEVRRYPANDLLTQGRIEGGYPYGAELSGPVGEVNEGERVTVCLRNAGARQAWLFGNSAGASLPSQASIGRRALPTDVTLVFLADERTSMLSRLPDVFERASVFRPGWVAPWVYWVLTALAVLGAPVLLARALADSADAP